MKAATLHIDATGMCCPVGMSTPSASAAIRAGLDHFQTLASFMDIQGKPVLGACLPDFPTEAVVRLSRMFAVVTAECLRDQSDMSKIPLILLVGEAERPGLDAGWAQELYALCTENLDFHASSRICSPGKAAIATALLYAENLLESQTAKQVLIVGVDSFLLADTLYGYMLDTRLFTSRSNDGFIPGEGAGAILLSLDKRGDLPGLHITGIGQGFEQGHILQYNLPNRASGMATAIRAAVARSGTKLTETEFHCGDCSGESYYFKEITHAILRCLGHKLPQYPHIVFSSSVGETGVAVGPLLLAYLAQIMGCEDGPGQKALVHFSADSGERTAVICEWR